jgi:endonuclease III
MVEALRAEHDRQNMLISILVSPHTKDGRIDKIYNSLFKSKKQIQRWDEQTRHNMYAKLPESIRKRIVNYEQ